MYEGENGGFFRHSKKRTQYASRICGVVVGGTRASRTSVDGGAMMLM